MSDDDYIAPIFLTDKAKELNDGFYLKLNELVKQFPKAKLKPNEKYIEDISKTNKAAYETMMNNMLLLQNEYFVYKNDIARESQDLLTYINELDSKILKLDTETNKLNTKLNELKSSSYSAEGLFDDAQITRNELLFGNTIFFIVILVGGFIGYKYIKSSLSKASSSVSSAASSAASSATSATSNATSALAKKI